ncbi:MAG TPA: TetR/AcrR family transcriptional regulator [Ktedonobacterales bacterium]|jgi:AcrR family transcriptional regulator
MPGISDGISRKPGRPRSAQANQAILRATLEELAEVGFEALSIEAVAARARVGKTTIYRRWPSKTELVLEAISVIHAEVPVIDTGSFRDDMLAMMRGAFQLRTTLVEQLLFKAMGEVKSNPEVFQVFVARHVTPRFQAIYQMIERAKARGELRQDIDPALITSLMAGPFFFQALFTSILPTPTPSPDLAEKLVDAVLYGIAAH